MRSNFLRTLATVLLPAIAGASSVNNEPRIAAGRVLAEYDDGGVFEFSFYPARAKEEKAKFDQELARLHAFVWSHWTTRRLGYVRIVHYGVEGQHFGEHLYIEPDARGRWRIGWVTNYVDWRAAARSSPGERTPVYTVERIRWRERAIDSNFHFENMDYARAYLSRPFFVAMPPLPPSAKILPTNYMLQMKDRRGEVVAVF